ncbi:PASTA domain-containing protein [Streptomyces sp. NPDC127584]|uniref:PASTA domain-containing protein n=1 Tax=Streptomyces sp. NPDC127584 TaxID=3345403 RepID=UPI00362F2690
MSDPLAADPRTAAVAAGEGISLSDGHRKVLLQELGVGEVVRSVYHDGWGYAVLTSKGLLLFRNLLAPKATRVPGPPAVLRSAYGMFDSVDVLVGGRPHKLHGSKLDPKGALLEAAGGLLPPDSPLRPDGRRRTSTWIRRHPVSMAVAVALVLVAGVGGTGQPDAVAQGGPDRARTVPDVRGASLASAAATARHGSWRVTAADASSAYRPVTTSRADWRVCFQNPAPGEPTRPGGKALTLYAVPEAEPCPSSVDGTRRVVMPDLVGERFDTASRTLAALDLDRVTRFHAHTGRRLDDRARQDLADWQVCRQQPEAGIEVPVTTTVDLWLLGPGLSCTAPSPTAKPKPKPKPKPEAKPKPEPRPRPSRDFGSGSSSGSGSGSVSGSRGGTSGSGGDGTRDGGSSGSSGIGGGSGSSRGSGGSGGTSGTSGGSGGGSGVGFGQFCSPVGATATTSDGRPAKCFMGKDGAARWGYRSG